MMQKMFGQQKKNYQEIIKKAPQIFLLGIKPKQYSSKIDEIQRVKLRLKIVNLFYFTTIYTRMNVFLFFQLFKIHSSSFMKQKKNTTLSTDDAKCNFVYLQLLNCHWKLWWMDRRRKKNAMNIGLCVVCNLHLIVKFFFSSEKRQFKLKHESWFKCEEKNWLVWLW